MGQHALAPSTAAHEGLVVWDQRGVVVRWANGEASHFSWETLRQLSRCAACQHHPRPVEAVAPHPPQSLQSLTL